MVRNMSMASPESECFIGHHNNARQHNPQSLCAPLEAALLRCRTPFVVNWAGAVPHSGSLGGVPAATPPMPFKQEQAVFLCLLTQKSRIQSGSRAFELVHTILARSHATCNTLSRDKRRRLTFKNARLPAWARLYTQAHA